LHLEERDLEEEPDSCHHPDQDLELSDSETASGGDQANRGAEIQESSSTSSSEDSSEDEQEDSSSSDSSSSDSSEDEQEVFDDEVKDRKRNRE